MTLSRAERLLQELGVTDPKEIDLEAIAYYTNASVKFRRLDGCEARIVGNNDKAIITVNSRSAPRRKRFSIAHELGHWHHHRGKRLACRAEEITGHRKNSQERIADAFAADLLLPRYLLDPVVQKLGKLTVKNIKTIADMFDTSPIATAIRLVENNYHPSLLVCHGRHGRRWFFRASSVPSKWFPQDTLDPDSYAFDILFGQKNDDSIPHKIGADAWFDRLEAARFEIQEQTFQFGEEEILTLLTIIDAGMLDD